MAAADIHHRTAEFRALYTRVLAQLKEFVGTQNDVILHPLASSGTGAMEASVSNLTSPGDRVLVLDRRQVRRALGRHGQSLRLRGRCRLRALRPAPSTLEEIKAALKLETRAVFVCRPLRPPPACATTFRHRQAAEGREVRGALRRRRHHRPRHHAPGHGRLGHRRPHRRIAEGVMIPPGLSYLAVSPRAWDRMEATYNPRYYFDLRKERKNAAQGRVAYTPAVALIAALGAALDWIAAQAGRRILGEFGRRAARSWSTTPKPAPR
jgi:aspartate aminotransferase-like enzyme